MVEGGLIGLISALSARSGQRHVGEGEGGHSR